MKVTKEQSALNRQTLIETAAKLFREKGFDGVGVMEISKTAGLTQGAFYAYFKSKEELATEASRYLKRESETGFMAIKGTTDNDLQAYINFYVSESNRDNPLGCPLAGYAGEIYRQGEEMQGMFTEGLEDMISVLQETLPHTLSPTDARRKAMAITVAMIGAVTLSRANRASPALSQEILTSVRQELLADDVNA